MNNKFVKKLAIPALASALLLSPTPTASAYTIFRATNNTNISFRYNFILGNNTTVNRNNFITTRFWIPTEIKAPAVNQEKQEPVQEPIEKQEPVQQPIENNAPTTPSNPTHTLPTESTSNAKHALTPAEIEFVDYVNQARAAEGLNPLKIDVDLSYVARIKSKDMHDNKYFSHTSPTYGSPFDMMKSFGIQYKGAAENIAKNTSVEKAHNSLMNSSGHKKNILNPNYTHIGVGIYNGYYTQMFIQR